MLFGWFSFSNSPTSTLPPRSDQHGNWICDCIAHVVNSKIDPFIELNIVVWSHDCTETNYDNMATNMMRAAVASLDSRRTCSKYLWSLELIMGIVSDESLSMKIGTQDIPSLFELIGVPLAR